ncbi:FCD domain-containing protein [Aurantimonas aggregata]|uniref:FCD domain-containing protein n=1 Tax=Aurantimonas aggregata TaxID=2047720 RepID=A0A6L9MIC2_9HYPH|nr:GntR family transcriptional regulator [Aurantimonas aggregata]NDV87230.1 FCD domain-containing protein [Aurantimonas aggregata]
MSISDNVHLTLRRRLMSGHYVPGTQLKEEAVAADLDVSRTPVRSAIQRLITEGLLEPAPKRGAIVTQWTAKDAEDIFNLRIMLEGYGASLAANLIDPAGIMEMKRLNNEMDAAARSKADGHLDEIHRLNLEFHKAIYQACGSGHLRAFGCGLLEFPLVIGGFYIYDDEDIMQSIRQHAEIIAALEAGNPDWAKAAVTCHLAAAIERFRRSGTIGSTDAGQRRDLS